jgi:NAD(P)-dependent dehydrogenase (short-subunit alcohol dehydrogenase family)
MVEIHPKQGDEMKEREDIFDLTGRVALVTGGSSGLGRVFCEALAEFGADIAIADLDEQGGRETADLLQKLGCSSLVIKADVSNANEVQRVVNETVAKLGRLDILVNNAGINAKPAKIAEISIDDWDRVLNIDLRSVFLCTRAALPIMVKQGKGCIINIASILGVNSIFEMAEIMPIAHYNVAKAGVISLTRETAVEYAKNGIRVNCIAPGWHRGTRLSSQWRDTAWQEEQRKNYEDMIIRVTPMGRRGELSELKGLVVFLASDASSFMTGQVLISDGGICA